MGKKPAILMIALLLLVECWMPYSTLFLLWALIIYFYQAFFAYTENVKQKRRLLRALLWPVF